MRVLKSTGLFALVLCVACPLLFLAEHHYRGSEAVQQAWPLMLTAMICFAVTALDFFLGERLRRTQSQALTGYYLLMKAVRMLVLILFFVAYALVSGENLLLFSLNLLVLFVITVAFSTAYYAKAESYARKRDTK